MLIRSFRILIPAVVFCLVHFEIQALEQTDLNFRQLEPGCYSFKKNISMYGDDFSKGTQICRTYVSVNAGDEGKGEMYSLHAGYGYFLWNRLSLNIDMFSSYIRSGIDNNGVGIGMDLILRKHFCNSHDNMISFYLDAGSGLQQQSTNFSGYRHFNFRLMTGIGGSLRFFNKIRLLGGVRYLHISDAGIKGGGGGFDGFMFYTGAEFVVKTPFLN